MLHCGWKFFQLPLFLAGLQWSKYGTVNLRILPIVNTAFEIEIKLYGKWKIIKFSETLT